MKMGFGIGRERRGGHVKMWRGVSMAFENLTKEMEVGNTQL